MDSDSTPVHTALIKGNYAQARYFIEAENGVNARDKNGFTPLIICTMIDNDEWSRGMSVLLLEHSAKISLCDNEGYNALHHACLRQRSHLVDIFLAALDCSIHSKSGDGSTSLHFAALLGNMQIVRQLATKLIHYKLTLDPKNQIGLTPLQQAWKHNQVGCGDLLVSFGADEKISDPEVKDKPTYELREEAVKRLHKIEWLTKNKAPTRDIRQFERQPRLTRNACISVFKSKSTLKRRVSESMFRSDTPLFNRRSSVHIKPILRPATSPPTVWRDQLFSIWYHYEQQHTKSFRKPAVQCDVASLPTSRRTSVMSQSGSTLSRKNSRIGGIKSRSGSITSVAEGGMGRRLSTGAGRRPGMPPLVRTQSRASFSSMVS